MGLGIACAGVILLFAGCQPSVSSQGKQRDVLAAYQFGTLDSKLGPEIQVLTVRAAAEQALRSRGYVVEKVSGGGDRTRIQARAAGQGGWDKVVVESWIGDRFTGVSVKVEPWGDEAESRAILDAVLNRLGR
jgi:hypothetical protein